MGFRNGRSLLLRWLTGFLGISCIVGTLFGLLSGYYLLAFSQIAFAAAMALIFFGAETRGGAYFYLTWACLGAGILATAVASLY